MTCDLVHYYLNEPVGDKHGEEFLVSTDRTLSHLTSGLLTLTYFRRKYLVTPSLLVQIRLNLSSLHFITITLVSEGTSSSYPEYICTARNRVLCWGFVVENWPFLLPFFYETCS